MAQLIHMRQRIKAVETIKKITHAMRLISMSTHSRLKVKKAQFEDYKNEFFALASHVKPPLNEQSISAPTSKKLIILVGSQKGLCGAFNTHLFKLFENDYHSIPDTTDIISIGKHATDYLVSRKKSILSFNDFTSAHFVQIALEITDYILKNEHTYSDVVIYSNNAKTFFVQKPQKTILIPFSNNSIDKKKSSVTTEYVFEDDQTNIYEYVKQMLITIALEELLFESLHAEQAARFLSMDASTRNADNLLVSMKLEYNKTRQAAITRELTELSSSL